jgi:hypothetical protein
MGDSMTTPNAEPTCARCGEELLNEGFYDDGSPCWSSDGGVYVCMDFHGHDEHGLFAPSHTPSAYQAKKDNARWYVLRDFDCDDCEIDPDSGEWVCVSNPALSR